MVVLHPFTNIPWVADPWKKTGNEAKLSKIISGQMVFIAGIFLALLFLRYGLPFIRRLSEPTPEVDLAKQNAWEQVLREAKNKDD